MVKIKGPLLSTGAHGSIAEILTFSKRKSGQQARKYNKPAVPPSAAQRAQRRLTEFLVAQWQHMTADQKDTWETNAKASGLRMSGYHFFLRETQRDLYANHGLCGYWSMNKIVNNKTIDLSGLGNDGTLVPSGGPSLITSLNDRFNNAMQFDGSSDYINCGTSSVFNFTHANNFYFEAWIKIKAKGSDGHGGCVLGRYGALGYLLYVFTSDGGYPERGLYFQNNAIGFISNHPLCLGVWYCVGYLKNATAQYLFVDGQQVATQAIKALTATSYPFMIGTYKAPVAQPMNGIIDEVCVYDRALTHAEIKKRYNFATNKV